MSFKIRCAVTILLIAVCFIFAAGLKGCINDLTPSWFSGPTKEQIEKERARLADEVESLKRTIKENEEADAARKEAQAAADKVLEEKNAKITALEADIKELSKKKKKVIDGIESNSNYTEKQKDEAIIDVTNNASWERYCRITPSHPDCKKE